MTREKNQRYTCTRAGESLAIDGYLREQAWTRVLRSPRFGDRSGRRSLFDTPCISAISRTPALIA